jgi:hypothetical protein
MTFALDGRRIDGTRAVVSRDASLTTFVLRRQHRPWLFASLSVRRSAVIAAVLRLAGRVRTVSVDAHAARSHGIDSAIGRNPRRRSRSRSSHDARIAAFRVTAGCADDATVIAGSRAHAGSLFLEIRKAVRSTTSGAPAYATCAAASPSMPCRQPSPSGASGSALSEGRDRLAHRSCARVHGATSSSQRNHRRRSIAAVLIRMWRRVSVARSSCASAAGISQRLAKCTQGIRDAAGYAVGAFLCCIAGLTHARRHAITSFLLSEAGETSRRTSASRISAATRANTRASSRSSDAGRGGALVSPPAFLQNGWTRPRNPLGDGPFKCYHPDHADHADHRPGASPNQARARRAV